MFLYFIEQHPDCTLGELFGVTKVSVAQSSTQNVSEFGDLSFPDRKVSEFFGLLPSNNLRSDLDKQKQSTNVAIPDVPLYLTKWAAIRAPIQNTKPFELYQRELLVQAKQEVEIMRLGRLLMSEKAASSALETHVEEFSVECVRELSLKLIEKCGHRTPFSSKQNNLLRSICLPGVSVPIIDWEDICM